MLKSPGKSGMRKETASKSGLYLLANSHVRDVLRDSPSAALRTSAAECTPDAELGGGALCNAEPIRL